MKLLAPFCFLLFLILGCTESGEAPETKETKNIQQPEVYEDFEEIAHLFEKQNDTTYVINFWATWCKPCVKELPYFEELNTNSKGKKLKVILISLDFPDQIEKKLFPFVKEKKLQSEVIALIDGDANSWIPKIAEEWSGAIPATLVYKQEQRAFYEQSFENYDELNIILKPFITL